MERGAGEAMPLRLLVPLLTLTAFLSAALLFLVQPMFGKMILPLFGGSPAVWVTSLVFFQLMLLAGYAYVHATHALLGLKRQVVLQAVLALLPLAVIPVRVLAVPGLTSPFRPITSVFAVLLFSVGLPFFVVSTTAPLLQRWLGSTRHPDAHDPFYLYAASNLGSLGALLSYPVIVEPLLELPMQSRIWAVAYGLLVVLVLACAVAVWKAASADAAPDNPVENAPSIPWRSRFYWIALAAVPTSLMLSVTSHITRDIAAVPLLWVIPLAIYLATFVLAFSPRTAFLGGIASRALPFVAIVPIAAFVTRLAEPLPFALFHLAALLLAAMACHGALAASRPGIRRLTEFYLWLSIGGAVGGLFNVLVAPFVFRTEVEYPLALILACLLVAWPTIGRKRVSWGDVGFAVALAVLVFASERIMAARLINPRSIKYTLYVTALPAILALMFRAKPLRFILALCAIALAAGLYPDPTQSVVGAERSFFGAYRILDRRTYRMLVNGSTNHGAQSLLPDLHCAPLTYYYPTGPLGALFASFTGPYSKSSIGVVGLGAGSIGGYNVKAENRASQKWTFYEIDPEVERIARDPKYFTFLKDCVPQAKVVLGDGRVSLAAQPDAIHDVIILDAFSSDAIPVHLMTRESMELYVRKLAPHGVLAFHISNRYLDLSLVLARLAHDAGLVAYLCDDTSDTPISAYAGKTPSAWVVMVRTRADIGSLAQQSDALRWWELQRNPPGRVWTDSYSNILETVKWRMLVPEALR